MTRKWNANLFTHSSTYKLTSADKERQKRKSSWFIYVDHTALRCWPTNLIFIFWLGAFAWCVCVLFQAVWCNQEGLPSQHAITSSSRAYCNINYSQTCRRTVTHYLWWWRDILMTLLVLRCIENIPWTWNSSEAAINMPANRPFQCSFLLSQTRWKVRKCLGAKHVTWGWCGFDVEKLCHNKVKNRKS